MRLGCFSKRRPRRCAINGVRSALRSVLAPARGARLRHGHLARHAHAARARARGRWPRPAHRPRRAATAPRPDRGSASPSAAPGAFSARPCPTTASLISAGAYSNTGRPGLDGGEHRHAARVSQLQRAPDVDGEEQVLDGDALRPAFLQQDRSAGCESAGASRETRRRRRSQMAPLSTRRWLESVGLDAAVAGALRAGIDAEHSHASEASMSFSETSKFDQMCCTSS